MKNIYIFISIPVLLLSLSCSASINSNNSKTVIKLLNTFFPNLNVPNKKPIFKVGDFNNDGLEDIVVLFKPSSKPVITSQVKVTMPWAYSSDNTTDQYRRSLFIFQKVGANWFTDKPKVFVMLDTSGVLETPSFKLIVNYKKNKDHNEHTSMLPVKSNGDLIILPTEAGIDTYIYWDENTYKFFAPEEIP